MNLVIETDLGRDPDDFFAICYFAMAGVNIRAITVSPGDQDQIAVAKFLTSSLGLNIPIGSAHPERTKSSSNEAHMKVLRKHGFPSRVPADCRGHEAITEAIKVYPDCQLFCCGPLENVGAYIELHGCPFKQATIQGGFVGYEVHGLSCQRLEKFEGKTTVPTFNLNGDVKSALLVLQQPDLLRQFVSKNVCHTILYDRVVHKRVVESNRPGIAAKLFRSFMDSYLQSHPCKAFHDPTAAVCHLHPEIATWINGRLYRERGGWGTHLSFQTDRIIVDIDKDALWKHIIEGN